MLIPHLQSDGKRYWMAMVEIVCFALSVAKLFECLVLFMNYVSKGVFNLMAYCCVLKDRMSA